MLPEFALIATPLMLDVEAATMVSFSVLMGVGVGRWGVEEALVLILMEDVLGRDTGRGASGRAGKEMGFFGFVL